MRGRRRYSAQRRGAYIGVITRGATIPGVSETNTKPRQHNINVNQAPVTNKPVKPSNVCVVPIILNEKKIIRSA